MPLPLMTMICTACGHTEMVAIGTLQLIGDEEWFNADGWRVRRRRPYAVRCAVCWEADRLVNDDDVERVRAQAQHPSATVEDIEEED